MAAAALPPAVPVLDPHSALFDIAFPAVPAADPASLLAQLFQFDRSQSWPPDALHAHQLAQLDLLLAHCRRNVPFYRDRLRPLAGGAALTWDRWRRIPLLTRRDIQDNAPRLRATSLPPSHGTVTTTRTSGSTGAPVETGQSALAQGFWRAISLRNLLWSNVDLATTLCVIRRDRHPDSDPEHGRTLPDWGDPMATVFKTGPSHFLDIRTAVAHQVAWLARRRPAYLVTYPSNAAPLARHCLDHGITIPTLRQLRLFGEVVTDELHDLCREAWGTPIADTYSCEELGYIAVQCPDHRHYHVQAETVLTEILDDAGDPCAPGQVGRVVVTALQNFATPLLRYDIGDYAEQGPPCRCGRTLPVLTRVLGRTRNFAVLPDGSRRYAFFGVKDFAKIPAIRQHQLVQTAPDRLDLRLILRQPLTPADEAFLRDLIHRHLSPDFTIAITEVDAIPRTESGKFEDFRCEIA